MGFALHSASPGRPWPAGSRVAPRLRGGRVFVFSSRRRHTRLQGDWSSDVCSSDLTLISRLIGMNGHIVVTARDGMLQTSPELLAALRNTPEVKAVRLTLERQALVGTPRSEERRGGEEGRSPWSPDHLKKKKIKKPQ